MSKEDPIVIVAAKRTPVGHFGGQFKTTSTPALGAAVIADCLSQATLKADAIDEVIMGCVLPAGLRQAPARQAALAGGLSKATPCTTINKMCGSGMKAVMQAHDAILAGSSNIVIAGGMENMSLAPYLLPKARFGYRLGHGQVTDHMMMDGLEDAYKEHHPMGYFAEECASRFHFTREQQDAFALQSLQRAQAAVKQSFFSNEITPVTMKTRKGEECIQTDEGPNTVKAEKIPTLKPAFLKGGTVTAANSSSISDGAACLILMRQSEAKKQGCKILATILAHATHAQEPEWFTLAPVGAIEKLLKKIDWEVNDVDLFEINEAFAVVTMAAIESLKLDPDKVNVNGGACVLGHPIGASGARILVTLIYALQQRNLKRGIASLCIGGGEATAIAIELKD
ncbi:MAG: acetyl-CoA C-acyltransferase [Coxiellaceae bacterium]|nr:acetyl-CoA C-acyltransferase [Coxiellaceae bacterium]